MVSPTSCKAIDCEFSAYGPLGWDLGQLAGNLLVAAARARVLGQDAYTLAAMVPALWTHFSTELEALWSTRLDRQATDAFLQAWLAELAQDARRYAACEIFRRVIGNIVDFAALEERAQEIAACGLLRGARTVLLEADHLDWAQSAAVVVGTVSRAATAPTGALR
jgi:5-methylthioribose kinase